MSPSDIAIEHIPLPPLVSDYTMMLIDKATDDCKPLMTDKQYGALVKGKQVFFDAYKTLKNRVYHSLFAYLKNGENLGGEEALSLVQKSYYLFLEQIHPSSQDGEHLEFFCNNCLPDRLISKIEARIYSKTQNIEISDEEKIKKQQKISSLDSFLSSDQPVLATYRHPDFAEEGIEKYTLFLPVSFFTDFSYTKKDFFSVSLLSFFLDIKPIIDAQAEFYISSRKKRERGGRRGGAKSHLKSKERENNNDDIADDSIISSDGLVSSSSLSDRIREQWNTNTTILDIQAMSLYKYKKLSKEEGARLSSIISLDKEAFLLAKKFEMAGIDDHSSIEGLAKLKTSNSIIKIIQDKNFLFSRAMSKEVSQRASFLFEAEYFTKQSEEDRIISMLNVIKMSFLEHSSLLPKINDDFYKKIQNEDLKNTIIEATKKIMSLYEEAIASNRIEKREEPKEQHKKEGEKSFSESESEVSTVTDPPEEKKEEPSAHEVREKRKKEKERLDEGDKDKQKEEENNKEGEYSYEGKYTGEDDGEEYGDDDRNERAKLEALSEDFFS